MPSKFEKANEYINTGKKFCFYWINNNQLVTATKSSDPGFKSDDEYFIMIAWGIGIRNNRDKVDLAHLYNSYCIGMQ